MNFEMTNLLIDLMENYINVLLDYARRITLEMHFVIQGNKELIGKLTLILGNIVAEAARYMSTVAKRLVF